MKKATDLWVVKKEGRKWGKAKALPDIINTSGRETTSLSSTPDGKHLFLALMVMWVWEDLIFMFLQKNKKEEWGNPINLGSIVNTVNDDTHFQYPELKKAVDGIFRG